MFVLGATIDQMSSPNLPLGSSLFLRQMPADESLAVSLLSGGVRDQRESWRV